MKKHITQTGKLAGQWVNCTAKGQCRNQGSTHIPEQELWHARMHHHAVTGEMVAVSKVPETAVQQYLLASEEDKEKAKLAEELRVEGMQERRQSKVAKMNKAIDQETSRAVAYRGRNLKVVNQNSAKQAALKNLPQYIAKDMFNPKVDVDGSSTFSAEEREKAFEIAKELGLTGTKGVAFVYSMASVSSLFKAREIARKRDEARLPYKELPVPTFSGVANAQILGNMVRANSSEGVEKNLDLLISINEPKVIDYNAEQTAIEAKAAERKAAKAAQESEKKSGLRSKLRGLFT